jgi:hypothetical protein
MAPNDRRLSKLGRPVKIRRKERVKGLNGVETLQILALSLLKLRSALVQYSVCAFLDQIMVILCLTHFQLMY